MKAKVDALEDGVRDVFSRFMRTSFTSVVRLVSFISRLLVSYHYYL